MDGTCDLLEDDTDGDGVIDAEDAFPDDPEEWLDTDEDGTGDNADTDDDDDGWSDTDENRCGSDPLNGMSIPANIEDDGTCVEEKSESKKDKDSSSEISTFMWCLCFPILLLLLFLLLGIISRGRGDSILVMVGMRNGPEPEYTSKPKFVSGAGTKIDPFVLKPAHVENFGDSVTSKETITITNLDPKSLITITDLAASSNHGRFNMDSIVVDGDVDEKGSGSIVFQMQFDDNVTEDDVSGVYTGQIRIGSASVYMLWEVTVGDPEADEIAAADARAAELKLEEEAKAKAEAEAKAEALAVEEERQRVEAMEDGPEKDAAMAKLAEHEAHAALKAEEARKLELYEEHGEGSALEMARACYAEPLDDDDVERIQRWRVAAGREFGPAVSSERIVENLFT